MGVYRKTQLGSKPSRTRPITLLCRLGFHRWAKLGIYYTDGFRMPADAYLDKKKREFCRRLGNDWLPELYFYDIEDCTRCSKRREKMLPQGESIYHHGADSPYPSAKPKYELTKSSTGFRLLK